MDKKDVFPIDDLGIINAMKMLYSLPENKKELKIKMSEIAENWRPYRSYACFYLWQYKDNYKSELAKN
jgi:DNA-3-methyladenine glycosylase II